MNRKQIIAVGAGVAMLTLSPQLTAADAEIKAKADLDRPRVTTDGEINDRDQKSRTLRETRSREGDMVKDYNKASGLIGMEVRNHSNQKLGELKDVVIDFNTGRVSYTVLAVGGLLGLGEKLIAVPMSALKTTGDDAYLVLNADRAKVEAAPGFAATAWPSVKSPEIDRFWGSATGAPAGSESRRDRTEIRGKADLDVDTDKKIYTDAEADKDGVRVDVDRK